MSTNFRKKFESSIYILEVCKTLINFGTDLLSEQHLELVPFRNGDFVSPKIYSVNDNFYDINTGNKITEDHVLYEEAIELKEKTEFTLQLSDRSDINLLYCKRFISFM